MSVSTSSWESPIDAVGVLAGTRLFVSLAPDELTIVAESCVTRRYGKGHYLCYQGDPGDRLFVIASGRVKVTFTSEHGDEMVLVTLGVHEVIGELAVIDEGPRSASVVAIVPTTVLMLSRPVLLRLMGSQPAVLSALLISLGSTVRRLTETVGDLVFLDLGAQLAKLLVRLAENNVRHGERPVLDLGLTQSDLAGMIGGSRPAVNRALQMLGSRGLLKIEGQKIVLRDIDGLRRRARS